MFTSSQAAPDGKPNLMYSVHVDELHYNRIIKFFHVKKRRVGIYFEVTELPLKKYWIKIFRE